MPRGHRNRVGDILAAIEDIRTDTTGMAFPTFEKSPTVVRSVLYSIGVIGEAVKAIAGLRDRVVHEYFRTNTRRVWDVVQDELAPLEVALQSAIDDDTLP